MPRTTKTNPSTRTSSAKTAVKEKPIADTAENKEPEKPVIPKDIDPEQYVVVRNGSQGRLVYISKHSGERFVWDSFGDEQEMQLRELKNAKSTSKKFFINNWFMFDDAWIVDYLGVGQFYKNAISIDDFDDIFKKSPSEIKKIVSSLSPGQKKAVAYRASQMIASGEIDSRKMISALEDALDIKLIEE